MRKQITKTIQLNISREENPWFFYTKLVEELGIPWEILVKTHQIEIEILPNGPGWIACWDKDGNAIEF